MLYKTNSATAQMSELDICLLTVKLIICICVLYYSILALMAIENSYNINDFNNAPCNDMQIVGLVCMTVVVSVGMIFSYGCYRRRQTELRLAFCILFALSIVGLYGMLFSELYKGSTTNCNAASSISAINSISAIGSSNQPIVKQCCECKTDINEKDIYLISWIWINLVSIIVFLVFVGVASYILYNITYNNKMNNSNNYDSHITSNNKNNTDLTTITNTKKEKISYLQSIFEIEHEHEL